MALLQISEPGQSTAPHARRLAVGIDLGTTHSLVATVRSGEAATLADPHGDHLLPSVVQYVSATETRVGKEAKKAAALDPQNTIVSVKRLMGRSRADIEAAQLPIPYRFAEDDSNVPRIQTVAGSVSAVEVSAEILKQLRNRAEATLGGDLEGSVITVPAYFDDAQRQATKDAARLAGLKVLRLINEPTAAAVAYGLDQGADGTIVVYDLGGGTFDVSILRLNKGVFEVLATAGDSALGGDDFDLAIANWIMEQANISSHNDHFESRRVLDEACRAKEALSTGSQVDLEITRRDGSQWHGRLTLHTMNELLRPLIRKTLSPCRRALRDAGIRVDDINEVVLVGGSTRVLQVREQVAEFFKSEVLAEIDPDKVVAIGAAIQADVLVGNKPDTSMLLLDVIPLSLGIETMGGLVEKIIPRNTTIPVARAQEFTTYKDGQSAMSLHVVQGEREMVSDCRSLARFTLHGIPPMVAGAAHIRVTFQVDADGLLSVTAQEKTTGVQNGIEVKPSYGLSDTEIEQMLTDSVSHAAEDMLGRRLREQQVEADRVLEALNAALASDGEQYLSESERESISAAMNALAETKTGDDHLAIKSAIAAVEKACASYVERRMNTSIQAAMAGHKVQEFED